MKILNKILSLVFFSIFLQLLTGCGKDFNYGNDRTISGVIKDSAGNIVAGDITSANFIVRALGADDIVPTDMRVLGDGSFQNTKLYATKYKVWVSGAVNMNEDTLLVDLSANKAAVHNFVVSPFITIDKPAVSGNPTDTTIIINYAMTAQSGQTISKRQLYCGTYPYPDAIIGSGASYTTFTVTLSADTGNVLVTGLARNTKYFIRVGALATGASAYNYSEQIEITTL